MDQTKKQPEPFQDEFIKDSPKKQRGRPKKQPVATAVSDRDISQGEIEDEFLKDDEVSKEPQVQKKGRGRPRKTPSVTPDKDLTGTEDDGDIVNVIKKKMGRPTRVSASPSPSPSPVRRPKSKSVQMASPSPSPSPCPSPSPLPPSVKDYQAMIDEAIKKRENMKEERKKVNNKVKKKQGLQWTTNLTCFKKKDDMANVDQEQEAANKDTSGLEGVTKEGVTKEGATKEGPTKEGVTKEGLTKEGVTKEGVTKEGVTKEGSKKENMVENGDLTDEAVNNKPFKCELCEMRYSKNLTLLQHRGKMHKEGKEADDQTHLCPYCDKRFTSLKDLELKHLKRGRCRKRYQCQKCPGEVILSKKQLESHNEKEHGTVNVSLEKTVDGKIKVNISLELRKKRADLMENVDGVWKCKVCGSTAGGKKVSLGRHVETHMDDLSLPCTVCSIVLKTTASLYNHMRLKHTTGKPELKDTPSSNITNNTVKTSCKKKVTLKKKPPAPTANSEDFADNDETVKTDDKDNSETCQENKGLKADNGMKCERCNRRFKDEAIRDYHIVHCSKGLNKPQFKYLEKWMQAEKTESRQFIELKKEVKGENPEEKEEEMELAFFSENNLELFSEDIFIRELEEDLGVPVTAYEGEKLVDETVEASKEKTKKKKEIIKNLDVENNSKRTFIMLKSKVKQEVVTQVEPEFESKKLEVETVQRPSGEQGSDSESDAETCTWGDGNADIADDDVDEDLIKDLLMEDSEPVVDQAGPDKKDDTSIDTCGLVKPIVLPPLPPFANPAQPQLTNMVAIDGTSNGNGLHTRCQKDIKRARKVCKKYKMKLLTCQAEKAKAKEKVSDLTLKLQTRDTTIGSLEKNCELTQDKCNRGLMQLISEKEENKGLSLRILDQIQTIARLENSEQDTHLSSLRQENDDLKQKMRESQGERDKLAEQLKRAIDEGGSKKVEDDQTITKLNEELSEKDKLMQSYRTTTMELVNQSQQDLEKETQLTQDKLKVIKQKEKTIASLIEEKKDLFEAVRKTSMFQSQVKSLQKDNTRLKSREQAFKQDNARLMSKKQSVMVNSSTQSNDEPASSSSAETSKVALRDPRMRSKEPVGTSETPIKPAIVLKVFSALGAKSKNMLSSDDGVVPPAPSILIPMDLPTHEPQMIPALHVQPKSKATAEHEYREYFERYQFEKKDRQEQIQEVLAKFKSTKEFIQTKLTMVEIIDDGERLKETLQTQLKTLQADRDKSVVEFKMIEKQYKDALDIYRKSTLPDVARTVEDAYTEAQTFVASPKYEPPSLDVEDVAQIDKGGSFLGRNPVVVEESPHSTRTSSPYSPTRLWGSDAVSPDRSETAKDPGDPTSGWSGWTESDAPSCKRDPKPRDQNHQSRYKGATKEELYSPSRSITPDKGYGHVASDVEGSPEYTAPGESPPPRRGEMPQLRRSCSRESIISGSEVSDLMNRTSTFLRRSGSQESLQAEEHERSPSSLSQKLRLSGKGSMERTPKRRMSQERSSTRQDSIDSSLIRLASGSEREKGQSRNKNQRRPSDNNGTRNYETQVGNEKQGAPVRSLSQMRQSREYEKAFHERKAKRYENHERKNLGLNEKCSNGQIKTCKICQSEYHLHADCPENSTRRRQRSLSPLQKGSKRKRSCEESSSRDDTKYNRRNRSVSPEVRNWDKNKRSYLTGDVSVVCKICRANHREFFCDSAREYFKSFDEWKQFCRKEDICLRCVMPRGNQYKNCNGHCKPFLHNKTQRLVDVICVDCPHDDNATGEAGGLHNRFCHCVLDKGKLKGFNRSYTDLEHSQLRTNLDKQCRQCQAQNVANKNCPACKAIGKIKRSVSPRRSSSIMSNSSSRSNNK